MYQTRSAINNPEIGGKLETSDKQVVSDCLSEVDDWLLSDEYSKRDYENKLTELNGTLQPIMMKAMSQGSEGFPAQESVPPMSSTQGSSTQGSDRKPTIEEID